MNTPTRILCVGFVALSMLCALVAAAVQENGAQAPIPASLPADNPQTTFISIDDNANWPPIESGDSASRQGSNVARVEATGGDDAS